MSTEPGAPVSALAVPVRSMPMPSPMTQTPSDPDERHGQRGAHRAPEEQADADEELDQREERVPHRDVGRQEVPDVGDEVAEDEGLPAGVGQDVGVDEAPAEHEGLELQGGVEDPEQAEDDLEDPLGADGEREAAVLAPLVRSRAPAACPGRCPCPALRYRRPAGWPGQGGEGSWKSWAMQSVGVTASATGVPSHVVVDVERGAVEAGDRPATLDSEVGQRAGGHHASTWLR